MTRIDAADVIVPPLVATSVPLSGDRGQCLAAVDKLHSMHSRGFTLVEMLAVMTISAILVALALPSFQGSIRSQQQISSASEFSAGSRSTWRVRRRSGGNVTVTVCRSVNPEVPSPDCSNAAGNGYAGNDWASAG